MRTVTKTAARRFMLDKQGLLKDSFHGKEGVLEFVKRVGCLQYDPIDVVGKNAELVLFSRIKNFEKRTLEELLYCDRKLLDQWDKNMAIYPVEDFPYFDVVKQHNVRVYEQDIVNHQAVNVVLDQLKQHTFLTHKDIGLNETIEQFTWRTDKLAQAVLDYLFFKGTVIVHHRKNTKRHFALARNHLDDALFAKESRHENLAAYQQWHLFRRIGALGLIWNKRSDAFLGIVGFNKQAPRHAAFDALLAQGKIKACQIEGLDETFYYQATDDQKLKMAQSNRISIPSRLEFLAPLDNLLWDRPLIKTVFGFDYTWEIYVPPKKRRYGHYVLPIVYQDNFVGRIQLKNDKKSKTLVVENLWLETTTDAALEQKLSERLQDLALFNDCVKVSF